MSSFSCPLVKVGKVGRVPNSDNLSICHIFNFPVIFRTGDFKEDDCAVYIPSDSVVPLSRPEFKFLDSGKGKTCERIRAKKLRGLYSDGLLVPLPNDFQDTRIGADLSGFLGVTKYEEPEQNLPTSGDARRAPEWFITYTDIENIRRYPHVLKEGEEIVCLEKLHGANGRIAYKDGEILVGSHNQAKKYGPNIWWKVVEQIDPDTRTCLLASAVLAPGYEIFFEVYGQVQDLKYGVKGVRAAAFDIYNLTDRCYLDYDHFKRFCADLWIPAVPELYRGPWKPELLELAEGTTTVSHAPGINIREGFVVKPTIERWDQEIRRVILKAISKDYKLRKSGTEGH